MIARLKAFDILRENLASDLLSFHLRSSMMVLADVGGEVSTKLAKKVV